MASLKKSNKKVKSKIKRMIKMKKICFKRNEIHNQKKHQQNQIIERKAIYQPLLINANNKGLITLKVLVLVMINLVQISQQQQEAQFSFEIKKNDHRFLEISPFSEEKTVKFSKGVVETLKSTKNYVGIVDNDLFSVHTARSANTIDECTFFEIGALEGRFVNYTYVPGKGQPSNMLLCLKRVNSKEIKDKKSLTKNHGKKPEFESQMSLAHLDRRLIPQMITTQKILCRFPYLDGELIKDFVFTYKGEKINKTTQIGVFIEKPKNHETQKKNDITVHYLDYNSSSGCSLQKKELTFEGVNLDPKDNYNYRVINDTIFFFKKSQVPMTAKQKRLDPIMVHYFPATPENPRNIKCGTINIGERPLIEEKSSVEIAELTPGQPYFILMGQSENAKISISKFGVDSKGEGVLEAERLMKLPKNIAQISDVNYPLLYILHVTSNKDLLIFTQNKIHEKLVINFCKLDQKPLPELSCSSKTTKIDIVGKFGSLKFFMRESSSIGNLISFDFYDQNQEYSYTANLFSFYVHQNDSKNIDNLKIVSTFMNVNKNALKKRSIAIFNYWTNRPDIKTIASYSLGFDKTYQSLKKLMPGPQAAPIVNYHHKLLKILENSKEKSIKFNLMILPSSTQDLLPRLYPKPTLPGLTRKEIISVSIKLIESCLSRVDFVNPTKHHYTYKDSYVGDVVRVAFQMAEKVRGSLIGYSLQTPRTIRKKVDEKIPNFGSQSSIGGLGGGKEGKSKKPIEDQFFRDDKYLNFNMLKSNNVEFYYPKSAQNPVVDDIFYTGQFILGVASKFSTFPLLCEEHLIEGQNDYKKYDVTPNRVKVINRYKDQTFYEFTFLESCKPLAAYTKIDFEKIIIEEVKTSENIIALKCRNISSFEHPFMYITINNQKLFEKTVVKIPIHPPYTRIEIFELNLKIKQLKKDYYSSKIRAMMSDQVLTSVTIFIKEPHKSKKRSTTASPPSSDQQESEPEMDFQVKAVFLKPAHGRNFQLEKQLPSIKEVKIRYGIDFAEKVRCIKHVEQLARGYWNSLTSRLTFGFQFLMIFGCQKTDLRGVYLLLHPPSTVDDAYLEIGIPFSTRVDLVAGFDLNLPVDACMTRSRMMIFAQNQAAGGVRFAAKDLRPNHITNDYDFDFYLFPFKRILRMVCVSQFDFGVIIGEVDLKIDNITKKTKKGLGFLIVKLSEIGDYHNRLFDYYTLDFIPKNIEEDIRVYPVVISRRPRLIILVKYMRTFYTRKILLDGPDIFITPRKESIQSDKNITTQSASFHIKYYMNNTKDYQAWFLKLELKTGFDKLKIKAQGYSMVINNTMTREEVGHLPKPSKVSSSGSGSIGESSGSQQIRSKNSAQNTDEKDRNQKQLVEKDKKGSNQTQKSVKLIPTPFYLLRWRTIYQDKPLKFDPRKTLSLNRLLWIQGHVIKLSVQDNNVPSKQLDFGKNKNQENNQNSNFGKNSKRIEDHQKASGLLTRASIDRDSDDIKPYFKHQRIDYLTPSRSMEQKMRLILGDSNIAPYCFRLKRKQDPTANIQYITSWCFKPPQTELIWYSPENLKQSLILSTDSPDYQLADAFDFFITKDRMVFTLIRKVLMGRYNGGGGTPSYYREFHLPMLIFTRIINSDSNNIINQLKNNPKFFLLKNTFRKKSVNIFEFLNIERHHIKGRVIDLRTWDAPKQTDNRHQVVFLLAFTKDNPESSIDYTFRSLKIKTSGDSREASPKEPGYWTEYVYHPYDGHQHIRGYFFMKVNSLQFRDPERFSRLNHGDPIYILYSFSTKFVDGESLSLITSTYKGTGGRDLGSLKKAIPMKHFVPDVAETYDILMPNDCLEVRRMFVSCVHVNNEHSMIENLFYNVKIDEKSQRVYLEMAHINKYVKHRRQKYIKVKQGFKYFGILIHPPNHEQVGIYVYKKIEYGGSNFVYYFLGLTEFAEVKDYDKVSFYFESGPPVKDPNSTLYDYNETLVVFSSKKNLFMRYNLTEFHVSFPEETQYQDIKKFKLVVENFQSSGSANFTSLYEKEKDPDANGTKNHNKGHFWERYEDWIEGLIYVAVVALVILGFVYCVKRKQRLERERITRDEDMIYDLDDFRF